jgi:hypothetical protein
MTWASSIVGLLYAKHPELFDPAVATIVQSQTWEQVTQLLGQIIAGMGQGSVSLSERIEEALIQRIRERQRGTSGETQVFADAVALIPNRLAREHWESIWEDWLPDVRVAFANALAEGVYADSGSRERVIDLLQTLAGDASYAARRAAYRGMALLTPPKLRVLCQIGAQASSAKLRERAAEASVWLEAVDSQDDLFTRVYGVLREDAEPVIREAAQRAQGERRDRLWAAKYMQRVLAVTGASNREMLATWRYGRALAQVGDDTVSREIRQHSTQSSLPSHVRLWLRRIAKAIDERWQKVMREWPQPWITLEGKIDVGEGML